MMRRTSAVRSPSRRPTLSQSAASAGGARRSRNSTTAATVGMASPLEDAVRSGGVRGGGKERDVTTDGDPGQTAAVLTERQGNQFRSVLPCDEGFAARIDVP